MAELAFVFHVTARAGRSSLPAFAVSVGKLDIPVPFAAHHRHDLAVLGHGVGFPVVVVNPAVTGGAGFRLAGFGRREFVPGVAAIAFVLVGVALAAAFGDLALGHGGKYRNLYVGFPVQGMRGTAVGPAGFEGPDHGVAFGFAFGKFLQVADAAHVCGGHAHVDAVVGFLLGVDVNVAVDTADFFQLLARTQAAHRAQVVLDAFQFGFLVESRVSRLECADLVQVGMAALLPGIHPHRRFVGVAFHAFLARGHFFHRGRRFVEGGRVHVHAERDRFPVLGQGAAPGALRRILVALAQRLMQLLGRGRLLQTQRFVGFLGDAGKVRVCRRRQHRTADQQNKPQPKLGNHVFSPLLFRSYYVVRVRGRLLLSRHPRIAHSNDPRSLMPQAIPVKKFARV